MTEHAKIVGYEVVNRTDGKASFYSKIIPALRACERIDAAYGAKNSFRRTVYA